MGVAAGMLSGAAFGTAFGCWTALETVYWLGLVVSLWFVACWAFSTPRR